MNLQDLVGRQKQLPPAFTLYTVPGWGKSTFGASLPNPIFFNMDNSLRGIAVDTFPLIENFSDVIKYFDLLLNEKHKFQTIVIDSTSSLERLIWKKFCEERNLKTIDDIDFYKGYKLVLPYWNFFLQKLDELRTQKMAILLLSHSMIERFESPSMDAYDKYKIKINKFPANLITEWTDFLFFGTYIINLSSTGQGFNQKILATGQGERIIYTEERPDFNAKKRTTNKNMPFMLKIPVDNGWSVISKFI